MRGLRGLLPGLGLAAGLGLLAHLLGTQVPVVGGPVLGILLGLVVGTLLGPRPALSAGTGFAAKKVLQTAVVLLGLGLSLGQVARIGWETLPVMLGTLVLALAAGPLIGKWLGVEEEIRTLVTVGTSICGASAIATVSAVTGAAGVAVAVSVAVIFVYNALAVLLFPVLGQVLGLSQEGFGLWAGTAVNDTSSVVAAATVYGAVATSHAVVVKLTRTLMIIPIAVSQSVARARQAVDGEAGMPWSRLVPPFLVLFLVAAAVNSVGLVPASWGDPVRELAGYLTTVALTAIGLGTPVRAVRDAGWRPLALGGVLWVIVAVSSLVLMRLTGHW
ncbi:YeiH family protein [Ornithinimicrobium cavernae]|uniref:YeiH family protein n=1 Tax=Ornithinimicrobium cavernae TaxID=2666047 RepID=UPI000D696AF0|nr:putative sulfate exporter family transporter [Ornithinimicrobium cavernae]